MIIYLEIKIRIKGGKKTTITKFVALKVLGLFSNLSHIFCQIPVHV